MNIAFIGGGNMARSLIGGLTAGAQARIAVADPLSDITDKLVSDFGVVAAASNEDAVAQSDVIVLAVKPQQMCAVLEPLKGHFNEKLLISVAAGVRCDDMARWARGDNDNDVAMVRCMPNTPALLQCGATGLYANDRVNAEQRKTAEQVLAAAGAVAWVDSEEQLDAITALSGSGPAYFFLLLEAMEQAAVNLGLSKDIATQFAIQTAVGASRMASEGDVPPAQLRRNVTSPAGTTEAALNSFEGDDFVAIVERAMRAANDRATELGKELGENK